MCSKVFAPTERRYPVHVREKNYERVIFVCRACDALGAPPEPSAA